MASKLQELAAKRQEEQRVKEAVASQPVNSTEKKASVSGQMTTLQMNVDKEWKKRLRRYAMDNDTNMTDVIIAAVTKVLDDNGY